MACQSRGRGFKSRRARHKNNTLRGAALTAEGSLTRSYLTRRRLPGERHYLRRGLAIRAVERGQLLPGRPQINLSHHRITPVDALGLVTDHFHRGGSGDACALQVAHRRPSEVVRDASRNSGPLYGGAPGLHVADDRAPVAVEDVADDLARVLLQLLGQDLLGLQHRAQLGDQGELAALRVLGGVRLQTQPARGEVHLGPAQRQQLVLDPPAREVGHVDERLERRRQLVPHGQVLIALEEALPRVGQAQAEGTNYAKFRAKAQAFLRAHQDHVAIHKLRMNKALTAADLTELERMLVESDVGAAQDISRAKTESQGLGLFVRSLVGMDREAAKEALAGFLVGKMFGANQIEFVNLVVNQLTEHGVMDAARLYESPFTDLTPLGPEGLFSSAQVDELMAVLERVKAAAIAA